mgnify:FL=1
MFIKIAHIAPSVAATRKIKFFVVSDFKELYQPSHECGIAVNGSLPQNMSEIFKCGPSSPIIALKAKICMQRRSRRQSTGNKLTAQHENLTST